MIRKTADDLQIGDVFWRETYRPPLPTDWHYTVKSLQRVPMHDFYGKLSTMVKVDAVNNITGPAILTLGTDEAVWLPD
jgi:hypothetical protein